MKNPVWVGLIACAAAGGCGGGSALRGVENPDRFVAGTPFQTLPEESGTEGGQVMIVTGIGVSEPRGSLALTREAAITSAQAELARKIESRVEAVWKRTLADWRENKVATPAAQNEALSVEEMKTMQKVIVDTKLTGPWQLQEVEDRQTGRYWVRILLSGATVDRWINQRINTEGLLRKYVIESQIKKVQEDLEKDLAAAAAKEREANERIKAIMGK
jgi:hypothetical protein